MYEIFQKASRVLAWLGLPASEHVPLLHLLSASPDDSKPWAVLENRSHGQDCKLSEMCDLADRFLSDTVYFGRAWIRQEVHAARELQMFCGAYKFHFNSLVSVSESLARARSVSLPTSASMNASFSAFQILKADYVGRQTPIGGFDPESQVWTDLLLESAFFDSTLPQDRIYAVLGMAMATLRGDPLISRAAKSRAAPRKALQVDYARKLPLVYADVMAMLGELSPHLEILLTFRTCHQVVIDDLPSWFPDFQSHPSGVIWTDFDRRARGILIDKYEIDGSLTIQGTSLAVVSSGSAMQHLSTFQEALAGDFPDEKIDLSAIPLRLYGCQWGMNGLLVLPIACRRLMAQCSFSLVSVRACEAESSERQGNARPLDLVALAPRATLAGDVLVQLHGSSACFLLRPSARVAGKYFFLGPILLFYASRGGSNWQLVDLGSEACSSLVERGEESSYNIC
jgi:hypothetical protein